MKKFYSVFGFLALLLLAGTALLHLALPDKAYSETEKRNLEHLLEKAENPNRKAVYETKEESGKEAV